MLFRSVKSFHGWRWVVEGLPSDDLMVAHSVTDGTHHADQFTSRHIAGAVPSRPRSAPAARPCQPPSGASSGSTGGSRTDSAAARHSLGTAQVMALPLVVERGGGACGRRWSPLSLPLDPHPPLTGCMFPDVTAGVGLAGGRDFVLVAVGRDGAVTDAIGFHGVVGNGVPDGLWRAVGVG